MTNTLLYIKELQIFGGISFKLYSQPKLSHQLSVSLNYILFLFYFIPSEFLVSSIMYFMRNSNAAEHFYKLKPTKFLPYEKEYPKNEPQNEEVSCTSLVRPTLS